MYRVSKLSHVDLRNNELMIIISAYLIRDTELTNVQLDSDICVDKDFQGVVEDLNDNMLSCQFKIICTIVEGRKCEVANDYKTKSKLILSEVVIDDENYESNNLTFLEIYRKTFYMLPRRFSDFFSNLRNLTIVESRLKYLDYDDFRGLKMLEFLNVSHNHLTLFPYSFDLRALYKPNALDTSYNLMDSEYGSQTIYDEE